LAGPTRRWFLKTIRIGIINHHNAAKEKKKCKHKISRKF
jgi:hypothetical protein